MFHATMNVERLSENFQGLRYTHPSASGDYRALILHGYGANAQDLFPIAPYLNAPQIKEWVFPDGLKEAPGVPGGRSWYDLDVVALEKAMASGDFRDFSGPLPPELTSARKKVVALLEELQWPADKTIVGGFSQGAMLATDLALNSTSSLRALLILSGTWLGTTEWQELASQRPQVFFQTHGETDLLLPFDRANQLHEMLESHQWKGSFFGFPGGHEIPPEALKNLANFLANLPKLAE